MDVCIHLNITVLVYDDVYACVYVIHVYVCGCCLHVCVCICENIISEEDIAIMIFCPQSRHCVFRKLKNQSQQSRKQIFDLEN